MNSLTEEDLIVEQGVLDVAVDNIQSLSHEEYALKRKDFFGASDSSIILGVNLYKDINTLLDEKNAKYLTEDEKAVGEKAIVKKGYDLEPVILSKAEAELTDLGFIGHLIKPVNMYKFKEVDGMSVNYDGVFITEDKLIPVEAKLVSKYGEKYYNKTITIADAKTVNMNKEGTSVTEHTKKKALRFGIPAYYYTQVQQELLGLNADYGFLAAQFDETWTFKLYYIPKDPYVQEELKNRITMLIPRIKRDTK